MCKQGLYNTLTLLYIWQPWLFPSQFVNRFFVFFPPTSSVSPRDSTDSKDCNSSSSRGKSPLNPFPPGIPTDLFAHLPANMTANNANNDQKFRDIVSYIYQYVSKQQEKQVRDFKIEFAALAFLEFERDSLLTRLLFTALQQPKPLVHSVLILRAHLHIASKMPSSCYARIFRWNVEASMTASYFKLILIFGRNCERYMS